MRISTNRFYDRSASALATLSTRADTLNTQIATGKRLAAPSDDSVAYQRLRGIAAATADDKTYGTNLKLAAGLLGQADAALSTIADQLQRASELAIKANNGTLSDANRRIIGAELAGIAEKLTGVANAVDMRGQPLLGGADGGAAVTKTADGGYAFATAAVAAIPIAEGQAIQVGEPASRVLAIGDSDALTVIATLAAALQSGGPLGDAATTATADLSDALDQVTAVQTSLGVRAARVEMETVRLRDTALERESLRSGLEDTDVSTTIIELQKTMTILSATQASFARLSGLSLFDYLR